MEKQEETTEEKFNQHTEKVIFDGQCDHYWLYQGEDSEGKGQAGCQHCVMGRYFNPEQMKVENGRIISR